MRAGEKSARQCIMKGMVQRQYCIRQGALGHMVKLILYCNNEAKAMKSNIQSLAFLSSSAN